jgi:hypothetical protein
MGNTAERSKPPASRPGPDGGGADTITVRVPLAIRKRGGRKVILSPGGASVWAPRASGIDGTLIRALARAHRWKRMLETGEFASVTELARAEKTNDSYVCRILRLTLLAPGLVEAVLNQSGQAPQLVEVSRPFPVRWDLQAQHFRPGAVLR